MASSSGDFNYDDDFDEEFDEEIRDLGRKEGGGGGGDDDEDDNTDDFIDSIREQLGDGGIADVLAPGDDDSLIGGGSGGLDLDLDADLEDYLKEIEESAAASDASAAAAGNDDKNQSGEFQHEGKLDLAACGVLTDGDDFRLDDLDLDLNDLEIDAQVGGEQKTVVSRVEVEVQDAAADEGSRLHNGDVLSQVNGSVVNATATTTASALFFQRSDGGSGGSDSAVSEMEKLAEEAALAQAALEDKMSGKLGDRTKISPSLSFKSGRLSQSGASSSDVSVSERRWSFKPVLHELDIGVNVSGNGLLERQVEESEQQLKKTVEGIQEAASELAGVTQKKEVAQKEVQLVQKNLARSKAELKRVEKEMKEHQSTCEVRKKEIGTLNKKRDQVKSELEKLEMILGEKRSFREGSPLGQSHNKAAEEYLKVLQENTHLRAELDVARNKWKTDSLQKQREIDELKKQVKAASEDLFNEKKRLRERYDKLKEEYENSQKQLRDVLRDKMSAIGRVKEEAESQKTVDLEVLKQRLIREKENEAEKLKEKMTKQMEEFKKNIQMKDKDLQKANARWRERSEAATALSAELRETSKHLAEKDAFLSKTEKKYQFQIDELEKNLGLKEGEVKHLKMTVKQQEESARSLGQKLREQAQEQIRKAVERQKQIQERSREQELRKEREAMLEDKERSIAELKDGLSREGQKLKLQQATITSLRQEVEEQKQIAKQASNEKLKAISKAKDLIRQARREEIDKLKDKLELEHRNALEKFKERVRRLEDEVRQTRENERRLQQKDRELLARNELTEKALLMDINEECRRTNSLIATVTSSAVSQGRRSRPGTPQLGTPPLASHRERPSSAPPGGVQRKESASTPKAALVQLRAANEELRRQFSDLKAELDRERQASSQLHRDKLAELKKVREETMEEKAAEMTAFKEKVLKELAAGKASLQKQAKKGLEVKLQRHLKEKDDEIRELRREIQQRREDENARLAVKQQEEASQEVERKAREMVRRLEIQLKAERAAHQREVDKLQREVKKAVQEASMSASASAGVPSDGGSKLVPATTTDAAKARAALQLARGLQRKLKQAQAENERLKAEFQKKGRVESLNDNSTATQDSGLSSMACDASPAPNELQQLRHEAKLSERKAHRAGLVLGEKTKEVGRLQDQIKLLNKEHLILQKQHGHALKRLAEE